MCPLSSAEPAQSPVPPPESGCAGQLPQTLVEQTLGWGVLTLGGSVLGLGGGVETQVRGRLRARKSSPL